MIATRSSSDIGRRTSGILSVAIMVFATILTSCSTPKDASSSATERQTPPEQLTYKGVTLDEWLDRCRESRISISRGIPRPKIEDQEQPTEEERQARQAIREIASDAIPILLDYVRATGTSFFTHSTQCGFKALGELAQPAVDDLIKLSEESYSRQVRRNALFSLGAIGPSANKAIPTLINHLDDPQVQAGAARALGKIGPEAARAVPNIIQLLKAEADLHTQHVAVVALGRIGPKARQAVPTLLASLKRVDGKIQSVSDGTRKHRLLRYSILKSFGKMHGEANEAVPFLSSLLRREGPMPTNITSRTLAINVIRSLAQIGTFEAFQALREANTEAVEHLISESSYAQELSTAISKANQAVAPNSEFTNKKWNARMAKHDGMRLFVLAPRATRTDQIPIHIFFTNQTQHTIPGFGETGYSLDCVIHLTDIEGNPVPYTADGRHRFSEIPAPRSQYAEVKLAPGQARHWLFDLSPGFKTLQPGKYTSSLQPRAVSDETQAALSVDGISFRIHEVE